MMISIRISEKPDSNWNDRLKSNLGTIYQTKEWGEILDNMGRKPIFLKFVDKKGKIVGQLLIATVSRLAKSGLTSKIIRKISLPKTLVYSWSYGPVVFDDDCTTEIFFELGNFLVERNCKVSGWGHPFLKGDIIILKEKFNVQDWNTFLIDLTKTKEQLFKNISKHNAKKNIERAIKRGVITEEITENNLIDYIRLVNEQRKKSGGELVDFNRMQKSWRLLKPLGYSGLLAKKNNLAIGGLLFSFFNKHIIEGGVARSLEDTKNHLYSQDLIKWKIIEWGVDNNMKYYNLAGVNPHPTSKKEEGILKYKKKWGGQKYDYWYIKR